MRESTGILETEQHVMKNKEHFSDNREESTNTDNFT